MENTIPVPITEGSFELLLKELDYLTMSNFPVNEGVICHPGQILELEALTQVACVYSATDRKLLVDIMRLAKKHLCVEGGSDLVPTKVQAIKRYGFEYDVISVRGGAAKKALAHYLNTNRGLICFFVSDELYRYCLAPLPKYQSKPGYLKRVFRALMGQ